MYSHARSSVCHDVRMSVCPCVRMSVCPHVRMPACPYFRMSVCPNVRMCPYGRMSVLEWTRAFHAREASGIRHSCMEPKHNRKTFRQCDFRVMPSSLGRKQGPRSPVGMTNAAESRSCVRRAVPPQTRSRESPFGVVSFEPARVRALSGTPARACSRERLLGALSLEARSRERHLWACAPASSPLT